MLDEHEADQPVDRLFVRHVAELRRSAVLFSEPRLLEVGVEALDDVVAVLLEPCRTLLSWKGEDSSAGLTGMSINFPIK